MSCIKGNKIVGHILKGFEMTYMQFPLLHDVHWVVGFTLNEVFFFSVLCGKAEKNKIPFLVTKSGRNSKAISLLKILDVNHI